MDYAALRAELSNDPVALGYKLAAGAAPNPYVSGTMTDDQAAALLNSLTTGRTQSRTAVSTTQVLGAVLSSEWPATSSASESKLRAILGMPVVDASSPNIRTLFSDIFAAGTTSRTNLLALATQPISRAQELGLPPVTVGDVTLARTKSGGW